LRQCRDLVGNALPLIGCGGVHDAASAQAKVDAGATLVQLYTGFIYKGLPLVRGIIDNGY
jgi:dihydroorotate dehydrogenase